MVPVRRHDRGQRGACPGAVETARTEKAQAGRCLRGGASSCARRHSGKLAAGLSRRPSTWVPTLSRSTYGRPAMESSSACTTPRSTRMSRVHQDRSRDDARRVAGTRHWPADRSAMEGDENSDFRGDSRIVSGKDGIYLDLKDGDVEGLAKIIQERHMEREVLWYTSPANIERLNRLCETCIGMPDPASTESPAAHRATQAACHRSCLEALFPEFRRDVPRGGGDRDCG